MTDKPTPVEPEAADELTTPERSAAQRLGITPAKYAALRQVRNIDDWREYRRREKAGEIR